MITGRWGTPSEVLLDLIVEDDGRVRGVANPGRQNAPIQRGHFDASSGAVTLDGEHHTPEEKATPFHIEGRLDGRTLRLAYQFGELRGNADIVRVEEYRPPKLTLRDWLKARFNDLKRWMDARSRPTGAENARRLRPAHDGGDRATVPRSRHPLLPPLCGAQ